MIVNSYSHVKDISQDQFPLTAFSSHHFGQFQSFSIYQSFSILFLNFMEQQNESDNYGIAKETIHLPDPTEK